MRASTFNIAAMTERPKTGDRAKRCVPWGTRASVTPTPLFAKITRVSGRNRIIRRRPFWNRLSSLA